ncbi:hydroxyacid dehydrogenase [Paenarthrobacter nitroguajacolicus]|uniref:2-hydroxyacid dehydrogenase n=1 Tax=Paenarthrobacter nitroguajacolicus TaxID=211146 RepID=UPI0015BFF851|nr:2-hydroxyacid dehydrogenase [Paenarthrobacter nitroguajacolicus]NWL10334.1 hydroxyacid dehydrogenase [Paenarthrobacter nitroguajacolicus]
MKKVVVTDPDVWPWLRERDDERFSFVFIDYSQMAAVKEALSTAWAYVGVFLDESLARSVGSNFQVAQITAAGTEHIAIGSLPPGITVANAAGHGRSIAEHVLMVLLAARRQLLRVDSGLRAGLWANKIVAPEAAPAFRTLDDSTVGIVGFGHIGRSIAKLCQAVGLRVIAVSRSARPGDPDAEWVAGMDRLPELLEHSDTIVLACPLTEETRGLIGRQELERLGSNGVLINVARGAVVDEKALFDALRDRVIASAAIDVWYKPVSSEPVSAPSTLPFGTLENIVMTPHYSATAADTYRERAKDVLETLTEAIEGRSISRAVALSGTGAQNG